MQHANSLNIGKIKPNTVLLKPVSRGSGAGLGAGRMNNQMSTINPHPS